MAATVDEMMDVRDAEEQPRVMDGNILRQESWISPSLATKRIVVYNDNGSVQSHYTEDV